MKCPHCQEHDKHGVYRTFNQLNMILRERVCESCGRVFNTKEEVYEKQQLIIDQQQHQLDIFNNPKSNK